MSMEYTASIKGRREKRELRSVFKLFRTYLKKFKIFQKIEVLLPDELQEEDFKKM
jgi:hypothetical protein